MNDYAITDQQLHWLSQIIAKANRTFMPSKKDDILTNLYFDYVKDRILGRWIETDSGKYILTFNLSNFHFEWLNASEEVIQSVSSIGYHIAHIEKEISKGLPDLGLDPESFSDKLHFDIPKYLFSEEVVKKPNQDGLEKWRKYRNIANQACDFALKYLHIDAEIRIWPHHFDTGIYVEPNDKTGIGFGLAMQDEMVGYPYFYLSGYSLHDEIDYSRLPELENGRWEIGEYWKGAVLPLTLLENLDNKTSNKVLNDFQEAAISWFIKS